MLSAGLRGEHLGFIRPHDDPHGVFSRGSRRTLQGVTARVKHALSELAFKAWRGST